tara:strand:- start:403 stop:591 length:189 start_codon:yes stop_codon:yes gene_type:complete
MQPASSQSSMTREQAMERDLSLLRGTLMTLTFRGQQYVVNQSAVDRSLKVKVVYRGQKLHQN